MPELIKINCSNALILASGGPLLHFDGYAEDDYVWCVWEDYVGKQQRAKFRACTLRRMIPFEIGDY